MCSMYSMTDQCVTTMNKHSFCPYLSMIIRVSTHLFKSYDRNNKMIAILFSIQLTFGLFSRNLIIIYNFLEKLFLIELIQQKRILGN